MERMKQIYAQLSHYRKTGQVKRQSKVSHSNLIFSPDFILGIFHRIVKGRMGHVEGNVELIGIDFSWGCLSLFQPYRQR